MTAPLQHGRPRAIRRVPESKRAEALELARAGRPLELIADKLRVSRDTLHAMRTRARESLARQEAGETLSADDADELAFALDLAEARADRAFALHDTVQAGGGGDGADWRSSAWLLERMHPDVYGTKQKVEHSGEVAVTGLAELLALAFDDPPKPE